MLPPRVSISMRPRQLTPLAPSLCTVSVALPRNSSVAEPSAETANSGVSPAMPSVNETPPAASLHIRETRTSSAWEANSLRTKVAPAGPPVVVNRAVAKSSSRRKPVPS
ncbi:hypothetical protein D3C81_803420 [compost metagenome]